jgi:hypothetical protein
MGTGTGQGHCLLSKDNAHDVGGGPRKAKQWGFASGGSRAGEEVTSSRPGPDPMAARPLAQALVMGAALAGLTPDRVDALGASALELSRGGSVPMESVPAGSVEGSGGCRVRGGAPGCPGETRSLVLCRGRPLHPVRVQGRIGFLRWIRGVGSSSLSPTLVLGGRGPRPLNRGCRPTIPSVSVRISLLNRSGLVGVAMNQARQRRNQGGSVVGLDS